MSKVRPQSLDRFRGAIQRGVAVDAAWADAFPDVSFDAIDATVRAYLRQPDRRIWWIQPGAVPRAPPHMRAVTRAELAQLRAELDQGAPGSVATVR